MENKTVKMVFKDLLSADNQRRKEGGGSAYSMIRK